MPDKVHTVSEISRDIRFALEGRFRNVWVEGEVSNLRSPGSGHHYFTLKDAGAQISCVMFRTAAQRNRINLQNGQKIQVCGDVSVYEARGQYQVIVQIAQSSGDGELQAQFEALKKKLHAAGLFDQEKKKPIPAFPSTVAVVTSPTGAAIQDILKVMARRAPWMRLLVAPVRVQGEEASGEIARAIQFLASRPDSLPPIDTIIVARGGGSMEDLWAFNEEIVAHAIYECPIPIISGVGHEIDFTISDFVADRREPTPSAAAEAAVPDGVALRQRMTSLQQRLESSLESHLRHHRRSVESCKRELESREPARRLQTQAQSVDYMAERMEAIVNRRLENSGAKLERLDAVLSSWNPDREIDRAGEKLNRLKGALSEWVERKMTSRKDQLEHCFHLLQAIGPEKTLKRGFSITLDDSGNPVFSGEKLKSGQKITTRFSDSEVVSVVEETTKR